MKTVRKTDSLCPKCLKKIPAVLIEKSEKILMRKKCPKHGEFEDVYYGDSALYKKYMAYFRTGKGVEYPQKKEKKGCPFDCGLCENHKSSTVLANLDVTNACNFNCPICFANASNSGYLYQPEMEEIEAMMDTLRQQKPPCAAIQFSGGEPTVRPDLPEIIRTAKEKGFKQIMIATNGKVIAEKPKYSEMLKSLGVSTIYLQFDGITPEPYIQARGFDALSIKKEAIRNLRRSGGPGIVLVPTLVKGVNDNQIGSMIRFAQENMDIVRGVNFQPVSFTGRISREQLKQQRITIPDMLGLIEEQLNGEITRNDFKTIPCLVPFMDFLKRTQGPSEYPELSTHPVCGVGTYVFKNDFKLVPITRIINVRELLSLVSEVQKIEKSEIATRILPHLPKLVKVSGLSDSTPLLDLLKDIVVTGSFQSAARFHRELLFIGSMHFMDPYNFDCERVERCCIHYVVPDGRVIPFCAYNTLHREKVEKDFSKSYQ